ncbi:twin-arginine translocation signal domain-containing protein [Halorubellus sp. PRR65]|uniref:twin-arginine translocation signal domain-containing protein n=1 Tax=Halorubellus sp. PRR65 TaxID=3098148 RepID=UPI002B262425|nr:twin-arginine translocation signal domain-containing protein [Halorubellus sp. PRR65]
MAGGHDDGTRSRRDVLRTAAATVAASGLGASAGCLATLPPLGERVQFGRVDAPAADEATYATWVPDASGIDAETAFEETHDVMYVAPSALHESELGRQASFPATFLKSRVDYFGHGFERYREAFSYGPVVALVGDVDRELAARTATDSGYTAADGYESYDVFERDDPARTTFVGDDVVAWAQGSTSRTDVRAVLDARDGRVPNRYERDEDFANAVDATGGYPSTWLFEQSSNNIERTFPKATHVGMGTTADDDGVYFVLTYHFGDGGTPSIGAARDEVEKRDRALASEATEVSVEDALVEVEIQHSWTEYRREIPVALDDWPQITWGVTRDERSVSVRHAAGDPVDAEWLDVGFFPEVESPPTLFESGTVGAGDVATLDRDDVPADTRRLYVKASPPEDDSTSMLLSVRLDREDA